MTYLEDENGQRNFRIAGRHYNFIHFWYNAIKWGIVVQKKIELRIYSH